MLSDSLSVPQGRQMPCSLILSCLSSCCARARNIRNSRELQLLSRWVTSGIVAELVVEPERPQCVASGRSHGFGRSDVPHFPDLRRSGQMVDTFSSGGSGALQPGYCTSERACGCLGGREPAIRGRSSSMGVTLLRHGRPLRGVLLNFRCSTRHERFSSGRSSSILVAAIRDLA